MTSRVLISTSSPERSGGSANPVHPCPQAFEPKVVQRDYPLPNLELDRSEPASAAQRTCPYQASHQAELLHLQAEAEALLLQLQTLKQQRSVTVPAGVGSNAKP